MDARTILLISVALNVPILMFMIQGSAAARRHPGQSEWIVGILLVWLASLLMLLRGTIPTFFSIALGKCVLAVLLAGVYDRNLVSGTAVAAPDFGVRHVAVSAI